MTTTKEDQSNQNPDSISKVNITKQLPTPINVIPKNSKIVPQMVVQDFDDKDRQTRKYIKWSLAFINVVLIVMIGVLINCKLEIMFSKTS